MSPAAIKWIVSKALLWLMALLLLADGHAALAQDAQPRSRDAGGPPVPYFEAIKSYREGIFYFNHGEYKQAIEQLQVAIKKIPPQVIAVVPAYQDMYWVLGEAQEAAGLIDEALASYLRWLMLAGDDAAPWTLVKVQALAAQSGAVRVALRGSQVRAYSH